MIPESTEMNEKSLMCILGSSWSRLGGSLGRLGILGSLEGALGRRGGVFGGVLGRILVLCVQLTGFGHYLYAPGLLADA